MQLVLRCSIGLFLFEGESAVRRTITCKAKAILTAAWSSDSKVKGRAIYYHSVDPTGSRSHHPDQFRAQLRWLRKNGWRDLLAREVPELLSGGGLERRVCITFDDGYRDNLEFALPILIEEGFRATFFVVAGMVMEKPKSSNLGNMLYKGRSMLSKGDLRVLAAAGMEVASHGWSHRQATELMHMEGFAALVEDLQRARESLTDIVGEKIVSYAYPNGQLGARSANTARAVQVAGYEVCASTHWGGLLNNHPLELNRCEMASDDSIVEFSAKMSGDCDWRGLVNRFIDRSGVWYK